MNKEDQAEHQRTEFVDDSWIAERLRVSTSTVRGQRFKRCHGQPHWMPLDAIRVGKLARYRRSDVEAWLDGLGKDTITKGNGAPGVGS